MDRSQFEYEARTLVERNPQGYDDHSWRIKYDVIDDEYFIRWTNGMMDRRHQEWVCYYKDGEFIYY